jgi:hypothetical protein
MMKNINKIKFWYLGISSLTRRDVLTAFYPKTGSTWVRIFFYNLFLTNGENGTDLFTFDNIRENMPELGNPNSLNKWNFYPHPRIIKTHRMYYPFYKKCKKIVFTRDSMDVAISFYHYIRANRFFSFEGSFEQFIYDPDLGLEKYFKFYSSWLPKADLIIRYEDLRTDPIIHFSRMVDFIEMPFSKEQIQISIEKSSLNKTRKAQKISSDNFNNKFRREYVFARKGQIGEGKEYFNTDLLLYCNKLKDKYNIDL